MRSFNSFNFFHIYYQHTNCVRSHLRKNKRKSKLIFYYVLWSKWNAINGIDGALFNHSKTCTKKICMNFLITSTWLHSNCHMGPRRWWSLDGGWQLFILFHCSRHRLRLELCVMVKVWLCEEKKKSIKAHRLDFRSNWLPNCFDDFVFWMCVTNDGSGVHLRSSFGVLPFITFITTVKNCW